MATIIPVRNTHPVVHPSAWLAPDAVICGDVHIGPKASIWFKAVIRGDVCSIRIGEQTNIQDHVIVHGTYKKSHTVIGNSVSIAHGAIIHGCTIHDRVLVGMRAVIMDHVIIEPETIVAAGAVVLENSVLESGFIYAGTPAKKIKPVDRQQIQFYIDRTAEAYTKYASWYET